MIPLQTLAMNGMAIKGTRHEAMAKPLLNRGAWARLGWEAMIRFHSFGRPPMAMNIQ